MYIKNSKVEDKDKHTEIYNFSFTNFDRLIKKLFCHMTKKEKEVTQTGYYWIANQ